MALKKSQKSLRRWTKQKWRTKSGKPSSKTGERYLPASLIKSMSSSEYAYETRKKRTKEAICGMLNVHPYRLEERCVDIHNCLYSKK
jgi:hypothetical protein